MNTELKIQKSRETVDLCIELVEPTLENELKITKIKEYAFNSGIEKPKSVKFPKSLLLLLISLWSCFLLFLTPKETSMFSLNPIGLAVTALIIISIIVFFIVYLLQIKNYKKEILLFKKYNTENLEYLKTIDIEKELKFLNNKLIIENKDNVEKVQELLCYQIENFEDELKEQYKKIRSKEKSLKNSTYYGGLGITLEFLKENDYVQNIIFYLVLRAIKCKLSENKNMIVSDIFAKTFKPSQIAREYKNQILQETENEIIKAYIEYYYQFDYDDDTSDIYINPSIKESTQNVSNNIEVSDIQSNSIINDESFKEVVDNPLIEEAKSIVEKEDALIEDNETNSNNDESNAQLESVQNNNDIEDIVKPFYNQAIKILYEDQLKNSSNLTRQQRAIKKDSLENNEYFEEDLTEEELAVVKQKASELYEEDCIKNPKWQDMDDVAKKPFIDKAIKNLYINQLNDPSANLTRQQKAIKKDCIDTNEYYLEDLSNEELECVLKDAKILYENRNVKNENFDNIETVVAQEKDELKDLTIVETGINSIKIGINNESNKTENEKSTNDILVKNGFKWVLFSFIGMKLGKVTSITGENAGYDFRYLNIGMKLIVSTLWAGYTINKEDVLKYTLKPISLNGERCIITLRNGKKISVDLLAGASEKVTIALGIDLLEE